MNKKEFGAIVAVLPLPDDWYFGAYYHDAIWYLEEDAVTLSINPNKHKDNNGLLIEANDYSFVTNDKDIAIAKVKELLANG